jgi:diguanylate cyclase (GGDEF)-like protein
MNKSTFSNAYRESPFFPVARIVRTCTAIACAGLIGVGCLFVWQTRERALDEARASTSNLVGVLTQHTERTVSSIDMLLQILARDLGPRADDPVKRSALMANLAQLARDLPHVLAVRLLDPGIDRPLFEFVRLKPVDQDANLEALQAHAVNRYLGLHVGTPYFDKTSQSWAVAISRRLSGREGVPGRVVLALLNLDYLQNFYKTIDMGPNGSITLLRSDGTMIQRHPFKAEYLGRNISGGDLFRKLLPVRPSGSYETAAVSDGKVRIFAYQRLGELPLVVTAGLAKNDILAAWKTEAFRGSAIVGIAILIFVISGELLARAMSRREAMERELRHAASHDALTGLTNRAYFQRELESHVENGAANGSPLCLLLIDLDEFKNINDTLGHGAGDALLCEIGRRLRRMPGPGTIARFGGDEFAIAVPGPLSVGISVAQYILGEMRPPFAYDGKTVQTAASIGITAFPDHEQTAAGLTKNADIALYAAKNQGRNGFAVFEDTMRDEVVELMALHEDVRAAIEHDRFVPYYQPQLSTETGEILGFEALARWQHPTRGLLTPAVFGSVFDNHELATGVGRRMLRRILADMAFWKEQGLNFGRIAFNASAAELNQPDFAAEILATLHMYSIAPAMMEIEVTEGVLFGKTVDRVQANLRHLNQAGMRIALDDFGTGYASLTHLKQFPIRVLKIDRSFTHNVESSVADASIVTAVIDMARGLNMEVVAEGVERPYQLDFLRRAGCSSVQGFLFAKPMAGSRVPNFIHHTNFGRPPLLASVAK